mgnify:CR=1 FL=1|jgi:flagellar hook-associated protein FlgK
MSVNNNSEQVQQLQGRVSSLVDEIHVLKNEVQSFKKAVAADMKRLVEHVNAK